jgi:hypothetical protein
LTYATYGWLTLGGTLHFSIDVLSQYLGGKRVPGPEATLYYGLNTAYALGQILFGLLGVLVAWKAQELLGEWPAISLTLAAAIGWFIVTFIFIEYPEPKFVVGIFGVLAIAAAVTR